MTFILGQLTHLLLLVLNLAHECLPLILASDEKFVQAPTRVLIKLDNHLELKILVLLNWLTNFITFSFVLIALRLRVILFSRRTLNIFLLSRGLLLRSL